MEQTKLKMLRSSDTRLQRLTLGSLSEAGSSSSRGPAGCLGSAAYGVVSNDRRQGLAPRSRRCSPHPEPQAVVGESKESLISR